MRGDSKIMVRLRRGKDKFLIMCNMLKTNRHYVCLFLEST